MAMRKNSTELQRQQPALRVLDYRTKGSRVRLMEGTHVRSRLILSGCKEDT